MPETERLAADLEASLATRIEAYDRHNAWAEFAREGGADPALVAFLERERDAAGIAIAADLSRWRRAGGVLRLVCPVTLLSAPADTPPRSVAEAAPPPAEPGPFMPQVIREAILEAAPAPAPAPAPARRVLVREVATPSAPSAPLASGSSLAALQAHIAGGGAVNLGTPTASDWPARLREALRPFLKARTALEVLAAAETEIDGLEERWPCYPVDVQTALLAFLAAAIRTAQEQDVGDERKIGVLMGTLSAYNRRERVGFVHGLGRAHFPRWGSWADDADVYRERLLTMAAPATPKNGGTGQALVRIEQLAGELGTAPAELREAVRATLRRELLEAFADGLSARHGRLLRIVRGVVEDLDGAEFRTLRRAVRELEEEERDESDDGGARFSLPADWPWWGFTRGRRAIMVGGDPREPNRVRLEQAFQFASLEWVPAEFRRAGIRSLAERVRGGKVDLLIMLHGFVGHDADETLLPACQDGGVRWVSVPHGYGAVAVAGAIERFLDP